jgi:uncharacterized protein (DUF169 family)
MKTGLKQQFIERWNKYFPEVALPIAFYYSDNPGLAKLFRTSTQHCMIEDLAPIRKGESLCFDTKSVACFGGKQCLGFTQNQMPNIEYFLSCGIPGKLEGERLVISPELAKELINYMSTFTAPGKFLVFKRWDFLEEGDDPQVVIFFAQPEVLSGLYMLANYDEPSGEAVFCPWGSGCSSIVQFPLKNVNRIIRALCSGCLTCRRGWESIHQL